MNLPSTERFSSRVENYVKYRPTYPQGVFDLFASECGLGEGSVVADIGSGTGISTRPLLESGATVYAIEPNLEMRQAAEAALGESEHFHSLSATAEDTTLASASVDLIVAGQAFHWFDPPRARAEFVRILKPGGWVALMWNDRSSEGTPFLVRYEDLLNRFSTEYAEVTHRNVEGERLRAFFAPEPMKIATFENSQWFDLEGLTGRLLSSSYAPEAGHPNHEPMLAELERIFAECQEDGLVEFKYETDVFYGHL